MVDQGPCKGPDWSRVEIMESGQEGTKPRGRPEALERHPLLI